MRVLQVARHGSVKGGAETYVRALSHGLREAGHDVVLAYGSDPDLSRPEVSSGAAVPLEEPGALQAVLERFAPDLVHVHTPELPHVAREAAARAPTLLAVHDHKLDSPAGTRYWTAWRKQCTIRPGVWCLGYNVAAHCGSLRANLTLRPYKGWRAAQAGARGLPLQVFSEHMRARLLAAGFGGQPVTATHYPVPPRARPQPPREDDPRPVVLASGRLNKEKGFRQLIDALTFLRTAVHLVIVGSGHDRDALETRAARAPGPHRVTFTGWLSPEELAGWLERAAVVAVPSMWPEPFGIVGLEAMAAARAVVAFDSGGIREWLADGETGTLVHPGDVRGLAAAIGALVEDEQAAARMGEAGRARVEREFSIERHLERVLAIYEETRAGWAA